MSTPRSESAGAVTDHCIGVTFPFRKGSATSADSAGTSRGDPRATKPTTRPRPKVQNGQPPGGPKMYKWSYEGPVLARETTVRG